MTIGGSYVGPLEPVFDFAEKRITTVATEFKLDHRERLW